MNNLMSQEKGLPTSAASRLDRLTATVKNMRGWRRSGLAFVAGAVGALAFAPFYLAPLLVVAFCVLVVLLDGIAVGEKPVRTALITGWWFGFGHFLVGLYWVALSFLVQAEEFAWMAPFAMFGVPAFIAVFPGMATAVAIYFWRNHWSRVLIFAASWSILEYARGHVLTGLPWNLAGQALAGTAVGAQSAAVYGVYGLSLIVVVLAASPAMWLGGGFELRRQLQGVVYSIAGFSVLFLFGAIRLAAPDPGVHENVLLRVVQPNIPQREKIDPALWGRNFARHVALSRGPFPPDTQVFVIWPENSAPLVDEVTGALQTLSAELPKSAILVAGSVRRENGGDGRDRYFNSIAVIPETPIGRRAVAHYDKHHLVPFGEYLPMQGVLRAAGLAQLAPFQDGFTAGAGPKTFRLGGPSFSPLICYEAVFPGALYPRGDRPDWLVTVTNDAWFGDSSGPRQHLDQARLRSIESGLPMARAANTGISAVIDPKGRYLSRLPLYTEGRITLPLPKPLSPTVYARFGDVVYYFLILGLFVAAYSVRSRNRQAGT